MLVYSEKSEANYYALGISHLFKRLTNTHKFTNTHTHRTEIRRRRCTSATFHCPGTTKCQTQIEFRTSRRYADNTVQTKCTHTFPLQYYCRYFHSVYVVEQIVYSYKVEYELLGLGLTEKRSHLCKYSDDCTQNTRENDRSEWQQALPSACTQYDERSCRTLSYTNDSVVSTSFVAKTKQQQICFQTIISTVSKPLRHFRNLYSCGSLTNCRESQGGVAVWR